MFKKPMYGSKVAPACAYYACRKYRYDPLRRVPHRQSLPHFDPRDFSLE